MLFKNKPTKHKLHKFNLFNFSRGARGVFSVFSRDHSEVEWSLGGVGGLGEKRWRSPERPESGNVRGNSGSVNVLVFEEDRAVKVCPIKRKCGNSLCCSLQVGFGSLAFCPNKILGGKKWHLVHLYVCILYHKLK